MYNYQQIIRVAGENGARAYGMMPNSSALLLDENAPLVWLVCTDGAGYKSVVQAYKIEKYEPEPVPDYNSIMQRLEKIERMMSNESDNSANDKTE